MAKVVFNGSYGRGDDLSAAARARSDSRVSVRVPAGAVSGPVTVVTAQGVKSRPTRAIAILPPPPPAPNPVLSLVPGVRADAALRIETGTSRTRAYVGARRAVTFSYRVTGTLATAPTVELVRASDGVAVRSWAATAPSGEVESVTWDGRLGRTAAKPGRYSFRLTAASVAGAEVRTAQTGDLERDAFDLYDNMFPVRGRPRLRRRQRGLRLRPLRAQPPGPGRVRQVRHAAGRGPRRDACSSSSTTPRPATTW